MSAEAQQLKNRVTELERQLQSEYERVQRFAAQACVLRDQLEVLTGEMPSAEVDASKAHALRCALMRVADFRTVDPKAVARAALEVLKC